MLFDDMNTNPFDTAIADTENQQDETHTPSPLAQLIMEAIRRRTEEANRAADESSPAQDEDVPQEHEAMAAVSMLIPSGNPRIASVSVRVSPIGVLIRDMNDNEAVSLSLDQLDAIIGAVVFVQDNTDTSAK